MRQSRGCPGSRQERPKERFSSQGSRGGGWQEGRGRAEQAAGPVAKRAEPERSSSLCSSSTCWDPLSGLSSALTPSLVPQTCPFPSRSPRRVCPSLMGPLEPLQPLQTPPPTPRSPAGLHILNSSSWLRDPTGILSNVLIMFLPPPSPAPRSLRLLGSKGASLAPSPGLALGAGASRPGGAAGVGSPGFRSRRHLAQRKAEEWGAWAPPTLLTLRGKQLSPGGSSPQGRQRSPQTLRGRKTQGGGTWPGPLESGRGRRVGGPQLFVLGGASALSCLCAPTLEGHSFGLRPSAKQLCGFRRLPAPSLLLCEALVPVH